MVLRMPSPYKHKSTGIYWLKQRVPARLAAQARGKSVTVVVEGRGKEGEPGLGLVKKTIDPRNPRAHVIQLTKDGRALAGRMADELVCALKLTQVVEMPLGNHAQPEATIAPQVAPGAFAWVHWEVWVD